MPSLISDIEKRDLGLVFKDIFDTFKRSITVHKEPVKIVGNPGNMPYAGYGEDSEEDNVTYVPQNKTFDAVISYNNHQTEINTQVGVYEAGQVKIKVEKEAADYIKTGKTERIEVDGKSFNKVTNDKVQDFLGIQYYVFYLEATS
jgi:hypothetical protein